MESQASCSYLPQYESTIPTFHSTLQRFPSRSTTPLYNAVGERSHKSIASDIHTRLAEEISALAARLTPTPEERSIYLMQLHHISNVVVALYPGTLVLPHGSFEMQTSLPDADLDIAIMFQDQDEDNYMRLHNLSNHLIEAQIAEPNSVSIIPSANLPLLKFNTLIGNISIDISVPPTAASPNVVPYVRDWVMAEPNLRPLVMVLKLMLKNRGLDNVYTGGIGGYALLSYVRSFLKRNQYKTSLGALFFSILCELSNTSLWSSIGLASDGSLLEKNRLWQFCGVADKPESWLVWQDPANPENNLTGGSFNAPAICESLKDGLIVLLYSSSWPSAHSEVGGMLGSIVMISPAMLAHRHGLFEIHKRIFRIPPAIIQTYPSPTYVTATNSGPHLQPQSQSHHNEGTPQTRKQDNQHGTGKGRTPRRASDAHAAKNNNNSPSFRPRDNPKKSHGGRRSLPGNENYDPAHNTPSPASRNPSRLSKSASSHTALENVSVGGGSANSSFRKGNKGKGNKRGRPRNESRVLSTSSINNSNTEEANH